jgi:hypothetical protein
MFIAAGGLVAVGALAVVLAVPLGVPELAVVSGAGLVRRSTGG